MHSRIRGKSDRPNEPSPPHASPWSDEATTAAWSAQDMRDWNDVVRHANTESSPPPSAANDIGAVEVALAIEQAGVDWLDVSNSWIETTGILDESALLELEDAELDVTTHPFLSPIAAPARRGTNDHPPVHSTFSAASVDPVLAPPSAARTAANRPLMTLGSTARPRLSAAGRQLAATSTQDAAPLHAAHDAGNSADEPGGAALEPAAIGSEKLGPIDLAAPPSASLRERLESATRRRELDDSRPVPTQKHSDSAGSQAAARRNGATQTLLQPSASDARPTIPPLPRSIRNTPVMLQAKGSAAPPRLASPSVPPKTKSDAARPSSARTGAQQAVPNANRANQTGPHAPAPDPWSATRTGAHAPASGSTRANRTGPHAPSVNSDSSRSHSLPLLPQAPLEPDANRYAKPALFRRNWVQGAALLVAVCGSSWFGYHLLTAEHAPILLPLHAAASQPIAPVVPETTTSAALDPQPQPTAAGAQEAAAARMTPAPRGATRHRWMPHKARAATTPTDSPPPSAASEPSPSQGANAALADLLPSEASDSPPTAVIAADSNPARAHTPETEHAAAADDTTDSPHADPATDFKNLSSSSTPAPIDRNLGVLRLNSRPWAEVFIDGRAYGHTPQTAISLPSGQHLVKLSNSEFGLTKIFLLEIAGGATVTRIVNLDEDP